MHSQQSVSLHFRASLPILLQLQQQHLKKSRPGLTRISRAFTTLIAHISTYYLDQEIDKLVTSKPSFRARSFAVSIASSLDTYSTNRKFLDHLPWFDHRDISQTSSEEDLLELLHQASQHQGLLE